MLWWAQPTLLGIDLELHGVLARVLVAFVGILGLHADGELQLARSLGNKVRLPADHENGPAFTDASDQRAPGNLVGNVPAVIRCAAGAGRRVASPGGHDDAAVG